MITAIRLRERNKKLNFLMRTYTSVNGTMFRAGDERYPSPIRIIVDPQVIAEVRAIPQFEVLEVEDVHALDARITAEMERRARMGAMAIRAEVHNAPAPAPSARLAAVVMPTPIGASAGAEVKAWNRPPPREAVPAAEILAQELLPHPVARPTDALGAPRSGRKGKSKRGHGG